MSKHNDMYDFGGKLSQVYKNKCKCGETIEVSTQADVDPEYYAEVYVKCMFCGESVKFKLPVN